MSRPAWYRRKPTEIKAVQVPEDLGTAFQVPEFVFLRGSRPELEVYNELHESWIKLSPGDFLRVDTPGDVYPIDRETFEATYDPIPEPSG